MVSIDEFGHIHAVDGLHRSIIYFLLGITNIDVYVIIRDHQWINFLNFFYDESINLYKKPLILYERINHPDFNDFHVIRDNRIEIVSKHIINLNIKTGLDLGCNIGTNTHYLSKIGIKMIGIEYEKKYYDQAIILNKTYNQNTLFINTDIYNFVNTNKDFFDIVIMLSIFYHLYRNDKISAVKLIEKISSFTSNIIIDDEPNTGILTENDISKLFEKWSIEKIYTGSDNRNIYLIKK